MNFLVLSISILSIALSASSAASIFFISNIYGKKMNFSYVIRSFLSLCASSASIFILASLRYDLNPIGALLISFNTLFAIADIVFLLLSIIEFDLDRKYSSLR